MSSPLMLVRRRHYRSKTSGFKFMSYSKKHKFIEGDDDIVNGGEIPQYRSEGCFRALYAAQKDLVKQVLDTTECTQAARVRNKCGKHFESLFGGKDLKMHFFESVTPGVLRSFEDRLRSQIRVQLQSNYRLDQHKPSNDTLYLMKLLEDIVILIRLTVQAQGKFDYSFAIFVFVKLRLGEESLTQQAFCKKINDYAEQLVSCVRLQSDEPGIDPVEAKIDSFADLLKKYDGIKNSAVVKKLYKFAMYAMSLSLFEKIGLTFDKLNYTVMEAAAIKSRFHLGPDFIYCLLDTLTFLCQRGYQCMKTGEISPLFHSPRTYEAFHDQALDLIRRSKLMHNMELFGDCEFKFRSELDRAIEKGLSIVKYSYDLKGPGRDAIVKLVNDLQMTRCDVMTTSAAKEMREAPFSILLCGDSSIGKSSLMDILYTHYGKINSLPIDAEYRYTRNAAAKYWDGFTTSQWCVVFDDVAFMHPNKAPQGDPSLMEIIQLINAIPFVPDQASLEDKGKTPVRAKLVVASTNTEDLNAHYYFACSSAVQRRFPYIIIPKVKPEYKTNNVLDASKCPENEGYPDLWFFDIKRVYPSPIKDGKSGKAIIKTTHEHISLKEFIQWFNKASQLHKDNQRVVATSLAAVKEATLCEICCAPSALCVCDEVEIQAQVVDYCYNAAMGGLSLLYYQAYIAGWLGCLATGIGIYQSTGRWFLAGLWIATYPLIEMFLRKVGRESWDCVSANQSVDDFLYSSKGGAFILAVASKCGIIKYNTIARGYFRRAGNHVLESLTHPKFLLWLMSYLAVGATIYKLRNALFTYALNSEEVKSENIGKAPVAEKDEIDNVWYKAEMVVSHFDYTPKQIGSRAQTLDDFVRMSAANCVHFEITSESQGKKIYTGAFCLRDNVYLCNSHAIPDDKVMELTLIQGPVDQGVSANVTQLVYKENFHHMGDDLAVIQLSSVCPKKDMSEFIATDSFQGIWNGVLLGRHRDGSQYVNPTRQNILEKASWTPHVTSMHWRFAPHTMTQKGDCGSILICETPHGFVVAGLMYAGVESYFATFTTPISAARALQQKVVKSVDTLFPKRHRLSHPMLSSDSVSVTLGDLHKKSPLRYIDKGSCAVYGSLLGFRCEPKSSVKPTIMHNYLQSRGFQNKHTQPSMRGWMPRRKSLMDIMSMTHTFNEDLLGFIARSMSTEIIQSGLDLSGVIVYDNFTAINGAAGVAYVDGIKRDTSAGFPWRKSKKYFLKAAPARGNNLQPVEVSSEILNRVDTIIAGYQVGKLAHPIFTAAFKDEPVSFAKATSHATRVFMGAPLDWSLVVRKYCLSFIRLVQGNRILFECGAGTVSQSDEWHEYYEYLTFFGSDRIVAGDYSKYDKRMSASVIIAAFDVMIHILEAAGYTDDDLMVVKGIRLDTAYPCVDYFGDLVQFYGCNPSGHPLTVIINSIANSIYLRYTYFLLNPQHEITTFKQNVHLMTYGDDNIFGVSKRAPWFNHSNISQLLAEFGIVYTMADKEATSVPYIHIRDATFLKRSWRWEETVKQYVCKLEEDSIHKSLMMWVPSTTICPEQQAVAVLNSAILEYFFYGREVFEAKRAFFLRLVEDLNLGLYYTQQIFPTWDKLLNRYRESSTLRRRSKQMDREPHTAHENSLLQVEALDDVASDLRMDSHCTCHTDNFQSTFLGECCCNTNTSHSDSPLGRGLLDKQKSTKQTQNVYETQAGEEELTSKQQVESNKTDPLIQTLDSNPGPAVVNPTSSVSEVSDFIYNTDAGLARFLERPILIKSYTWTEGADINVSFQPWLEYLNAPLIKNKLQNYFYGKMTLHLKFVVNASPFYYGMALASYLPMQSFNSDKIFVGDDTCMVAALSQRPHVCIYPQASMGGEMELPFLYHLDAVNLTSIAEVTNLGEVTIKSVVPLDNANAVVGTGATIRVFAHASNVKIGGPTFKAVLQSGAISEPASAVANIARRLQDVPVIGRFARATTIGAQAVAGIASLFGFTDVPVIRDVEALKNMPFHSLTSAHIGEPVTKLCLDPNNEVSIDPSIPGAEVKDQLTISTFVDRHTIVGYATWSASATPDTLLWTSRVTPMTFVSSSTGLANGVVIQGAPCNHVANLYAYWRGGMTYKIVAIASKFHRGRYVITWDPIDNMGTSTSYIGYCFTKVVDISEETEIEFTVPYLQNRPFLTTATTVEDPALYPSQSSTTNLSTIEGRHNGKFSIRVFTQQTSPVATADIRLVVMAKGAEDLEFAMPKTINRLLSPFVMQSDDVDMYTRTSVSLTNETQRVDPERYLISFGEPQVSLRALLRRATLCYMDTLPYSATASDSLVNYLAIRAVYPISPGYDPKGVHSALKLSNPGSFIAYNWVNYSPIDFVSSCFAARRGSITHHFNINAGRTPMGYLSCAYAVTPHISNYWNGSSLVTTTSTVSTLTKSVGGVLDNGASGCDMTTGFVMPAMSVMVPHNTFARFMNTNPKYSVEGTASDGTDNMTLKATFTTRDAVLTQVLDYIQIGTDYSVSYFINVPPLYRYSALPGTT